jgi:hypothetical protein
VYQNALIRRLVASFHFLGSDVYAESGCPSLNIGRSIGRQSVSPAFDIVPGIPGSQVEEGVAQGQVFVAVVVSECGCIPNLAGMAPKLSESCAATLKTR